MNLYVSNLGDDITDESLRAVFATHGEVSSYRIIKDNISGHPRGFAFVEMPNDNDAQIAMGRIHGMIINGRSISVKEARPKAEQKSAFTERWKTDND